MKNKWHVAIWNEGKYIDFWFFNHFLSGFLLASFLIFLEMPTWLNILLLFILMITWEVFEYKHKVRETIANRVVDLVAGLLGFLLMYLLAILNMFDYGKIFMGTFILLSALEIWGFWAYKEEKKTKSKN